MARISPDHYILLLVLLQVLVMIQPSSSEDLVYKVCICTNDPKSCVRMLNQDTRTPTADLSLLGEIAIDLGLVMATNVSNLIIWTNDTTTDGRVKQILNSCFDSYDYAKDMLVNSSDALKSKSYETMNREASYALYASLDCEKLIKGSPVGPSPILVLTVDFFHMCQAIVVIANDLARGIPKRHQLHV